MKNKQRYEWDCFLACITELVDGNYSELWGKNPDPVPGFDNRCFIDRMMKDRGIFGHNVDAAFGHAGLRKDRDYWCASIVGDMQTATATRNLLRGRRAILQVPSLNYENGMHIVYWDGKELHDPSTKQTYKFLDHSLQIHYAWVFNELPEDQP